MKEKFSPLPEDISENQAKINLMSEYLEQLRGSHLNDAEIATLLLAMRRNLFPEQFKEEHGKVGK